MTKPAPQAPTLHVLQRRSDNRRVAAIEADLMPTLLQLRLDSARTTYVGAKGDLTAWITDVELPARKREPALMLANKTNPKERHAYVLLRELWMLLDPEDLGAAKRQGEAIAALTERLYGFVTKQDLHRVLDAIYDFAQDLVHAKPPAGFNQAQWLRALAEDDMTLTFNGEAMNG